VSTTHKRRKSERAIRRERASLIFFSPAGHVERLPCLIVDQSRDGFQLSVDSGLRQGQLVDLILDEDPPKTVRCSVAWIGEQGSELEGRAGLQTV
jgi:hypothetical protein